MDNTNWIQRFSRMEIESMIQKKEGAKHEYIDVNAMNQANSRKHPSKLSFFRSYQSAK